MTNDKALEYQVLRKLINQVSFHTDWPLTIKISSHTIFTQIKDQNFFPNSVSENWGYLTPVHTKLNMISIFLKTKYCEWRSSSIQVNTVVSSTCSSFNKKHTPNPYT